MKLNKEETRQLKIALKLALEVLERTVRTNERLMHRAQLAGYAHTIASFESRAAQPEEQTQTLKKRWIC